MLPFHLKVADLTEEMYKMTQKSYKVYTKASNYHLTKDDDVF